jgi:hypothetical protein
LQEEAKILMQIAALSHLVNDDGQGKFSPRARFQIAI